MNNTEKSYKKLPPFVGWTLQNFPFIEADFDSITSYQMMCKVVGYLQIIQENVDYIQFEEFRPLYDKFIELKNYVDTYFDNLDLQEEVNNKLDEMAESGELAEIIAQYLEVSSVLAFNTKADLKDAENLINGSICRTLGTSSYNDGYGYYYKIRTVTTGDIIDDDNILALVNYPTLIAEKIVNYNAIYNIGVDAINDKGVFLFNDLNDLQDATYLKDGSICRTLGTSSYNDGYGYYYKVRELESGETIDGNNLVSLDVSEELVAEKLTNYNAIKDIAISSIHNEDFITIFVGDSYGNLENNNWVIKYCNIKGLTIGTNAINLCSGGAGFHDPLEGSNTYLNNLTNGTATIDKTKVGKIIVCGGWNDRALDTSQLDSLTSTFMTYVKANFPNAKVYCGMIGNTGALDPYLGSNVNWREWIPNYVLNGYKTIEKYGGIYLTGVECVMHKYSYFNTSDYIHPNNDGSNALGEAIYHAVETGNYCVPSGGYEGIALTNSNFTFDSTVNTNSNINMLGFIQNNNITFNISGTINFSSYKLINSTDSYISIEIGTYTTDLARFRYCNYLNTYHTSVRATLYNNTAKPCYNATLSFTREGKVVLTLFNSYATTVYISSISLNGQCTIPVLFI